MRRVAQRKVRDIRCKTTRFFFTRNFTNVFSKSYKSNKLYLKHSKYRQVLIHVITDSVNCFYLYS